MKKKCSGYRDEIDLIFRYGDVKPKRKSHKLAVRKNEQLSPPRSQYSPNSLAKPGSRFILSEIGLPLREDMALCFFYQTTLESLENADRARNLHLQFPTLFSRCEAGSALHLAAQAISLAVFARSRPNDVDARQMSRRRYAQSLAAMNAAIRDPVKVKSDGTLYAVLLLSGYEVRCLRLETGYACRIILISCLM
jgi:hypothetical protein